MKLRWEGIPLLEISVRKGVFSFLGASKEASRVLCLMSLKEDMLTGD